PETRMLFFETSTNPRLRVADIPALAELGHRRGLVVVAANTFLNPAVLRPIEHGADLVVHAATKSLSGHGDAVSGVVAGPRGLLDPIPKATAPFAHGARALDSSE